MLENKRQPAEEAWEYSVVRSVAMPRFSDRIGITQPRTELQLEEMNDALSVALWNWAMELLRQNEER